MAGEVLVGVWMGVAVLAGVLVRVACRPGLALVVSAELRAASKRTPGTTSALKEDVRIIYLYISQGSWVQSASAPATAR